MNAFNKLPLFTCCALVTASLGLAVPLIEYGVVYTTNGTFRFVGDSIDLYCNITNRDLRENSSKLHIERLTKTDQNVVSPEDIEILTTRAIRYRQQQLDVDDDGDYTCFQETFSGDSRIIGSETIQVDYKPRSIQDISCRVYNWQQMKCTWDLGLVFQYPEYIRVSLAWTIHGEQHDCPHLANTSCLWDSKTYVHGHQYLMVLEVSTVVDGQELARVRSPQFRINTDLHVEPAPVNNFQATVESSTCIFLTWEHSAIKWPKFFVAESRRKGDNKWTQIIINQDQDKKDYNSPVCNLQPFTEYDFRMSVLPFPVETVEPVVQGYKSEWKMVSAKTMEDVPSAAPKLCSSCFHDYRCPDSKQHRCVRMYWQGLKTDEQQGVLTHYKIMYTDGETGKHTLRQPIIGPRSLLSANLELPNINQTYKVSIFAGTSQGFSRHFSSIILPAAGRKPKSPGSFLVETDNNYDGSQNVRFYLSWAALSVEPRLGLRYSNLSILWCCGQRQEQECQSDINWIQLLPDQVTYELELDEDYCPLENVLIGVAADVANDSLIISSGIAWSSCIYTRNRKPQQPPRNVHESTAHPVNALTVRWDKFDCAEDRSFITEYLIRYCPVYEDNTCSETEKIRNVSNTVSEVTLHNLKEESRYKVSVIAVSSAGLGPSTSIVTQTVKGSPIPEPEFHRPIGIIIAVLSFLALLTIIIFLWRYCFHWKKKVQQTENLIEPYAQSSESTRGCKKAKKNTKSESCSEESGTSCTNLLNMALIGKGSPTPREESKTNKQKKQAANSKIQNYIVEEAKLLQSFKPQTDAEVVHESPAESSLNNVSSSPVSQAADNFPTTAGVNPCQTLCSSCCHHPSLQPIRIHRHSTSGDINDSIKQPEIIDQAHYCKSSTLSLRKYIIDQPYSCTQQMLPHCTCCSTPNDPRMLSHLCGNIVSPGPDGYFPLVPTSWLDQSAAPSNHTCNASVYYDPRSPSGYRTTSIELAHPSLLRSAQEHYAPNGARVREMPELKRFSAPLEYCLYNSPHRSSPPPPYPGQVFTNNPMSPVPPELSHMCQCPHSPEETYRTSFSLVAETPPACPHSPAYRISSGLAPTGHSLLHFSSSYREQHPSQTLCSDRRLSGSSVTFNISPVSSPGAGTQHPSLSRRLSGDGTTDNFDDYQYDPAISAHTFPRHIGKDSSTLQLPSSISVTRPLSGDLLDLPPEYYQDPEIKGSNIILTEL